MKCKIIKSKVCNPMGECEIPLFFDRGFVSFDDVKSVREELMKLENQKYSKRAKVDLDAWDDEEEKE